MIFAQLTSWQRSLHIRVLKRSFKIQLLLSDSPVRWYITIHLTGDYILYPSRYSIAIYSLSPFPSLQHIPSSRLRTPTYCIPPHPWRQGWRYGIFTTYPKPVPPLAFRILTKSPQASQGWRYADSHCWTCWRKSHLQVDHQWQGRCNDIYLYSTCWCKFRRCYQACCNRCRRWDSWRYCVCWWVYDSCCRADDRSD